MNKPKNPSEINTKDDGTSGPQSNDPSRISYDDKDVIGKGTISSVFRGSFRDDQRQHQEPPIAVAVKVLKGLSAAADSPGEEALAQLQHPNVVKLFHAENQSTNRCYALELCDASLDKVFSGDYDGPVPSPANALVQLSRGLEFIHSNGLIHGSVKPENVLVSLAGSSQMKWADFGLYLSMMLDKKSFLNVKGAESGPDWKGGSSNSSARRGFLYLAPELVESLHQQGRHARKSIQGDIFASGCVFVQLLTGGHHPFGSKDEQIISNIKTGHPVNLAQLSSHYAHNFFQKMVRNNPNQREGALKALIKHIEASGKLEGQKEFLDLCSVSEPTDEEVKQLRRMVQFDDVDVNQPGIDGNPPLVQLLRSSRKGKRLKDSIEALLMKEGQVLDVNGRDERGYNALHLLCINCDQHAEDLADIVRLLVENGMKAGERDPEGKNALHHLCKNYKKDNLLDIIRLLNITKEDVNCKDSSSWSPCHHLCRWYQNAALINIVELFIEKGVDVNIPTSKGWTALHFLCQFYREGNLRDLVHLFIKNGANLNLLTTDGFNSLHFLCKRYQNDGIFIEVIRLLVSKGVDVNAKTSTGATAFKILEESDPDGETTKEVVQFLLKHVRTPSTGKPTLASQNKGAPSHHFTITYEGNVPPLGQGYFAAVFLGSYKGEEGKDPIQVAVKRVQTFCNSKSTRQEEDRELEALKRMDHPNVIKLFHHEDQPHFRLYALELCQGTLHQAFLSEDDEKGYRGPLPSPANLLVQLSNGLDHIHSKSLAHRDIKPDNILISSGNRPAIAKWADFGLSKPLDAQGAYVLSRISAAQHYWSPETYDILKRAEEKGQLTSDYAIVGENEKGTASSDIFAFGCVAFWFLTGGQYPFGPQSNIETNVKAGNPVNLHILSRHYALPFIKKMLSHQPEERKGVLKELTNHIEISKKLETEFVDLCSLSQLIPEEVNQLRRMVLYDDIDVNKADPSSGKTPLMRLCLSNRAGPLLVESIASLMARKEQEIQVNKADKDGRTALHSLCRHYTQDNLIDIGRLLIQKGADVNCKDDDGRTALYCYLYREYEKLSTMDLVGTNCNQVLIKEEEWSQDWSLQDIDQYLHEHGWALTSVKEGSLIEALVAALLQHLEDETVQDPNDPKRYRFWLESSEQILKSLKDVKEERWISFAIELSKLKERSKEFAGLHQLVQEAVNFVKNQGLIKYPMTVSCLGRQGRISVASSFSSPEKLREIFLWINVDEGYVGNVISRRFAFRDGEEYLGALIVDLTQSIRNYFVADLENSSVDDVFREAFEHLSKLKNSTNALQYLKNLLGLDKRTKRYVDVMDGELVLSGRNELSVAMERELREEITRSLSGAVQEIYLKRRQEIDDEVLKERDKKNRLEVEERNIQLDMKKLEDYINRVKTSITAPRRPRRP